MITLFIFHLFPYILSTTVKIALLAILTWKILGLKMCETKGIIILDAPSQVVRCWKNPSSLKHWNLLSQKNKVGEKKTEVFTNKCISVTNEKCCLSPDLS